MLKRAIGIIRSTSAQVVVSLVAPNQDHIFAMVQTLELEPGHETTLRENFLSKHHLHLPSHIHHARHDVSGCSYTYIIDGRGDNDIPTRHIKITKRYDYEAAVRRVGLFHILEL